MKKTILMAAIVGAAGFAFALQEAAKPDECGGPYDRLYRNFNRNFAMPFFRKTLLADKEKMPAGGEKAAQTAAEMAFDGIWPEYWEDALASDFDPDCRNLFYRALTVRTPALVRKERLGQAAEGAVEAAKELYLERRMEASPAIAAELAAALCECLDGQVQEAMREKLIEDAERMLLDPAIGGPDTIEFADALIRRWDLGEDAALLERLEKNEGKIDGWLMEELRGRVKYKQAWDTRGRGYSRTVTRDGWKEYGELIMEAEAHLRKAFLARPDIFMSTVWLCKLEQPDADEAEQEEWYKASLKARMDSRSTKASRLFHLTSRWGGGIEEMERELDRLAPMDGDFHTKIPALNISLRWNNIAQYEYDRDDPDSCEAFFRRGETAEKTLATIREYMKPGSSLELEPPADRDKLWRDFMVAAYCCGDYRLMEECWRRITPTVWKRRFSNAWSDEKFAPTATAMWKRIPFLLEAAQDPGRFEELCQAYRELEQGDLAKGLESLLALGNQEPANDAKRRQLADDVHKALYRQVETESTSVSLMEDLLTGSDPHAMRGVRLPKAANDGRTSFRRCTVDTWYAVKGIKRNFEGSTEFTFRENANTAGGQLEFWPGPPSLYGNQVMPVVKIFKETVPPHNWRASVWENTGKRDTSWSRYNDPKPRDIVKSRPLKAINGEIRVRVDFGDGMLLVWANGILITPKPLNFALDGKNSWYDFNFRQTNTEVTEHWLSAPEAVRLKYERPEEIELPPFESQERLFPLPTAGYATNAQVTAAAELEQQVFPDYNLRTGGTWWGVKFNSSELIAKQDEIKERLEAAIDNEVWGLIPDTWRGQLALRFAALAHQAGDLDLAAEYLHRYAGAELLNDPQALAVPDDRYDKTRDPGSHGRELMQRLTGNCTALRAAWWRAGKTGRPVEARDTVGFMKVVPVGREYTGYALSGTEDWKFTIHAQGDISVSPCYGKQKNEKLPSVKIAKDEGSGKMVATISYAIGDGTKFAKVDRKEFDANPDGSFTVEIANRGGKLSYRAGTEELAQLESPLEWLGYDKSEPGAGFYIGLIWERKKSTTRITLEKG